MSPTQKPPTISEALSKLVQVEKQAQDLKERDRETINKARACDKFADFVVDNTDLLTTLGATDTEDVVKRIREWSEVFAPQADLKWDKAEVSQFMAYLEAMIPFGALTEEQEGTYESVKETLASVSKGGTGVRGPRTPQDPIEGRPQRVITSFNGVVKSNQAGNLPNSVSNIKNTAVKLVNSVLEKDGKALTEEHAEQIKTAVNSVVVDGKASAEVLGLTFAAAAEEAE